jgi:hypothetical protein
VNSVDLRDDVVRVKTLAVATCNRMALLKRCLKSYIRNVQLHGRECNVVIVDDSPAKRTRQLCREWLRTTSKRLGIKILYAGLEEKSYFGSRLVERGVPPELVHFLLGNPLQIRRSPGANRNAHLLHCVGEPILCCDDDSVCILADFRHGDQRPKVVLSGNSSLDVCFVPNRRAAIKSTVCSSEGIFEVHEALLGRVVEDLKFTRGVSSSAKDTANRRSGLDGDREQVVGITLSGVVGDSGMPNLIGFMLARGGVRERFLQKWNPHKSPQISRCLIRGVCRPVMSPLSGVMMTTATGLDNRIPLPPFAPSGRGEDTLFGVIVQKCFGDVYTGFVPFGLLHAPEGQRQYEPLSTHFRLADIIMMLLQEYKTPRGSYEEQLRSLGIYLGQYANMSNRDFRTLVVECVHKSIIKRIEICEGCLEIYGARPPRWAVAMRSWIIEMKELLHGPDLGIPSDLQTCALDGPLHVKVQWFIATFGTVLQNWSEITKVARQLREQDCTLAKL